MEGLFAGARLYAKAGKRETVGGVGGLLTKTGAPEWLLTAGHLFPREVKGTAWVLRLGKSVHVGDLEVNGLDLPSEVVDLAIVRLNAVGRKLAKAAWGSSPTKLTGVGAPKTGAAARVFRATTSTWASAIIASAVVAEGCRLQAPRRGVYEVSGLTKLDAAITFSGDSGCPLVLGDDPGNLVAITAGLTQTGVSVFQGVGAGLHRLGFAHATVYGGG